jgi:glycosyltransferase involved in cell wall biosynthesis
VEGQLLGEQHMTETPARPRRILFFHIMKGNFSGAQKNIFRLLRRIDRGRLDPILVGQAECELTRQAAAIGIKTMVVPFPSGLEVYDRKLITWNPHRIARAVAGVIRYNVALIRVLRPLKPDVIWCDNIRTFFTMLATCRLVGATVIWNVWSEPTGRVAWILHRLAFFLADIINLEYRDQGPKLFGRLACSRRGRRKLVPLYTGVSDFETSSGHGIRSELGLDDNDVLILMASNIVPGKGQMDLVKAAKQLYSRWPRMQLLVAGAPVEGHGESADYHAELLRLVETEGMADRVRFLGWRSDVQEIMEDCDIYVSTSYSESFPDSVREAMRVSKPVVVTDVGGTRELVHVGESGYLFQPGDVSSLTAHLEELVGDAQLRHSMGNEGSRIIREQFSTEVYARKFEEMVLAGLP